MTTQKAESSVLVFFSFLRFRNSLSAKRNNSFF
jgi:hypothetical protein